VSGWLIDIADKGIEAGKIQRSREGSMGQQIDTIAAHRD
jgi:hypothetical protein